MAFSNDNGGLAFACSDAKMSIGASTWATRLSQLGNATGEILILTRDLADIGYITNILDKRPYNIWIVAHTDCIEAAQALKAARPWLSIATLGLRPFWLPLIPSGSLVAILERLESLSQR